MSSRAVAVERGRAARIHALGERHGFGDLAADSIANGHSVAEFETRLLRLLSVRQSGGSFSFARMLSKLADGSIDGLEREVLQETARVAGKDFDPQRVIIPWSAFQRTLTVDTAIAGGYLVGTDVGEALDALRPWSITARAGITVLERLRGNLAIPKTTETASGFWIPTESTPITVSQPGLGQIAIAPKIGGGFIKFSRQLAQQANADFYVSRELLRTLGTLADQAVLNGSGANGEPSGLLQTAGILTESGTSLGHAGVTSMKRKISDQDGPDDSIAFIGTPAVRELLENRERATSNGYVWDDDQVASRPGFVTTDMPAGTLVAGAWLEAVLALWGSGFTFEVNPFDPTGFKVGTIEARVLVAADVAIAHAEAFCVAESVT